MILELLGILISLFIFLASGRQGFGSGSLGQIAYLWDLPSIVCILLIALPIFFKDGLKAGLAKDFLRAFKCMDKEYRCSFAQLRHTLDAVELMQRQILYAGCITALESFFILLHTLSDAASVGPMTNVALTGIFYTAILELLLLPLQVEVKRRIIDYMEEDADTDAPKAQEQFKRHEEKE